MDDLMKELAELLEEMKAQAGAGKHDEQHHAGDLMLRDLAKMLAEQISPEVQAKVTEIAEAWDDITRWYN